MISGSLFSGYGGLDLAIAAVFGTRPAWWSEIDPAASRVLAHRWPDTPNLGDITKIDWTTVEPVDVLTGGFPCQDVSHAGKRAGLRPDTRSGLWSQMAYAIDQLRPRLVVAENVRGLLSAEAHSDMEPCEWCLADRYGGTPLRALGAVLGGLADLGYDARWCGLRAADVGAPHGRFRVFIVAADTRGVPSEPRWSTTPGQTPGGWARGELAGRDSASAADPDRFGRSRDLAGFRGPAAGWPDIKRRSAAAADTSGQRHGRGQDTRGVGRVDSQDADQARERQRPREVARDRSGQAVDWGAYEPAVRRWEHVTGRVAPAPIEPGAKGGQRLSPRFVEWMMGLEPGWVTDVPGNTRNDQLRMLGNGVVPQQAEAALRTLL